MLKSAFELGLFGGETGGLGFAAGLQLGIEAGELLFDGLRRNLREDRMRLRHRSSGHDRLGLPRMHGLAELVVAGDDRVREARLVEILNLFQMRQRREDASSAEGLPHLLCGVEIWQRVDHALKSVGMTKYRTHSPNKLSGGQKQRVAIAGVVAMEPKCIVFDEPTAMLDPNGRKEVIATAHELNRKKGVTILLITHYMEEVVDADYVYVMEKGKIIMDGTPRQIFSRVDELKEHRLDVPQITLVADELKKAGLDIPDGILRREELVDALMALA